jgi:hypothetical protein
VEDTKTYKAAASDGVYFGVRPRAAHMTLTIRLSANQILIWGMFAVAFNMLLFASQACSRTSPVLRVSYVGFALSIWGLPGLAAIGMGVCCGSGASILIGLSLSVWQGLPRSHLGLRAVGLADNIQMYTYRRRRRYPGDHSSRYSG